MTVTEFESYLQKGLGQAILLLREEPDKEPFREAVLQYLCSPGYADVSYKLELIACFANADDLAKEAAQHSLACWRTEEGSWDLYFLDALGYRKECEKIVESHYRRYREEMRSPAEDSAAHKKSRLGYIINVENILSICSPTVEQVKAMLPDIAFYFSEVPEEDNRGDVFMLYCHLYERFGKEITKELLEEGYTYPYGDNWKRLMKQCESHPAEPVTSVEELLRMIHSRDRKEFDRAIFSVGSADTDVICGIAEAFFAEPDIERRHRLLTPFLYNQSVRFPYPERLVDCLIEEDWNAVDPLNNNPRTQYLHSVLSVLSPITHPKIAAIGKRLRNGHPFRLLGIHMLVANYTPEDREELTAYLEPDFRNTPEFVVAIDTICKLAEKGVEDMPLDQLISLWENMGSSPRISLVSALIRIGVFPDTLREACRYDGHPEIRKLVKEVH